MSDLVMPVIPMLHFRWEGRSEDVPLSALDVGDRSSDSEVKNALAVHYNVPPEKLRDFVVDRQHDSGNITVMPPAVFG